MNKLVSELRRLYFFAGQPWHKQKTDKSNAPADSAKDELTEDILLEGVAIDLVSKNGMTRTMIVDFNESKDWKLAARLYQAVQSDLDFPAPAVSVSGDKGYRLWLSLSEPVTLAQTQTLLKALRVRYLADIQEKNISFQPEADITTEAAMTVVLPPSQHIATGKWSAFIDPSMGDMFIEEPWLEMAPNMTRQADMLASVESITSADFHQALLILQSQENSGTSDATKHNPPVEPPVHLKSEAAAPNQAKGHSRSKLNVGNDYSDPFCFLQAVMNDSSASGRSRIAAAKALLPYFRKKIV